MSYLTFGKGEDLILGHGMAQNKNLWLENGWVKELSKIRRVHIFDFPGHGVVLQGEEREQLAVLLEAMGLLPFLENLEDGRAREGGLARLLAREEPGPARGEVRG